MDKDIIGSHLPKTEEDKPKWVLEIEAIEAREAQGWRNGVSERDLVW